MHPRLHLLRAVLVLFAFAAALAGAQPASAAVSYIGTAQNAGSGASLASSGTATATVSTPAHVANDVLIASVSSLWFGTGSGTFGGTPAGWTQLQRTNYSTSSGGGTWAIYYRVATGSDAASYSWSQTWSTAYNGAVIAAQIDVYRGVDILNPATAVSVTPSSSTTISLPNVTAPYNGGMRVSSVMTATAISAVTPTAPTSTYQASLSQSNHREISDNVSFGVGGAVHVSSAHEAQNAGSTPSRTDTLSRSYNDGIGMTFVLNPGAGTATQLSFTTEPVGGVPEGTAFPTQPAVSIQDASGITNYANTDTITLAKASGPASGVLSCTGGLSKAAVNGVATFAGCQITGTAAAGTYTISATATGLTGDTSTSFTITVGSASKLGFTTEPVGGVAEGVALPTQPVVTIFDAYDNVVTGSSAAVTLSKASGPGAGVLGCTTNPRTASSGVATFAGCQITGTAAAGTYTLQATASGLTAASSSSFTIVVGAATQLAFTTQPVGGVAEGVSLPTQPAVTVQDAYGNTVTSSSAAITLTKASGPGAGVLGCTTNPLSAGSGVATFAGCQITGTAAAGTYTLQATASGLTAASSSSFTIVVGAANRLAFSTQPVGNVGPGMNLSTQPAVVVQDAYGNTVTSSSASIALAKASGPAAGSLSCTTNPLAATSGTATYAGCRISGTGSDGTYTLQATSAGLTAATSASFTILAAPTVTALSPANGPTGGGTVVVITGTNFTSVSAVTFGGTAAAGYTVNSATQITATTPAHAAGLADVLVTTTGGTSANTAADDFTYVAAPTVTVVSPNSGTSVGGTTVVITGTNFVGVSAVTFGGTAAGYTVDSATQITATSPAHASGLVDIRVTAVGGTSANTAADDYTYASPPTVTSLSPTSGTTLGGTSVTITGTNFTGTTSVTFGGTSATGYTVVNATTITATSPAHAAGLADVRVTTPDGTSANTAADDYTYVVPCSTGGMTATQPDFSFPTLTLNGLDRTQSTTTTVTVSDMTGAAAGWKLAVGTTQFSAGGGRVLPTNATRITGTSATPQGGACVAPTPAFSAYPVTLPISPSTAKIYSAAVGTGTGPVDITLNAQLDVPASTRVGTYQSIWTLDLTAAP